MDTLSNVSLITHERPRRIKFDIELLILIDAFLISNFLFMSVPYRGSIVTLPIFLDALIFLVNAFMAFDIFVSSLSSQAVLLSQVGFVSAFTISSATDKFCFLFPFSSFFTNVLAVLSDLFPVSSV